MLYYSQIRTLVLKICVQHTRNELQFHPHRMIYQVSGKFAGDSVAFLRHQWDIPVGQLNVFYFSFPLIYGKVCSLIPPSR